jgi:hypothetical protein
MQAIYSTPQKKGNCSVRHNTTVPQERKQKNMTWLLASYLIGLLYFAAKPEKISNKGGISDCLDMVCINSGFQLRLRAI